VSELQRSGGSPVQILSRSVTIDDPEGEGAVTTKLSQRKKDFAAQILTAV
jgi:hypothetical protein